MSCCQTPTRHHGHAWHTCCGGGHFHRRFLSREERVERLRRYLEELRAEAAQVEKELRAMETEG